MSEQLAETLGFAADEYKAALGLIRDLLADAERIYEPGFEDPPHIAAARNLTDHEGALKELEAAIAQIPAIRKQVLEEMAAEFDGRAKTALTEARKFRRGASAQLAYGREAAYGNDARHCRQQAEAVEQPS